MIRRIIKDYLFGNLEKHLFEISQIQEGIKNDVLEIKSEIANGTKELIKALVQTEAKIASIDRLRPLDTCRLSDRVLEALLDSCIAVAGGKNEWAEMLGEKLLLESPLGLNEGIFRRLSLSERLALSKLFCFDEGYRRRLHLVDLLQKKWCITPARPAKLSFIEKLAVIGTAHETNMEKNSVRTKSSNSVSHQEVLAKLFWGDNLIVLEEDLVGRNLLRDEYFEAGLTQFMLLNLDEDAVFFDVGAHFGYYAKLAAQIVKSPGQIHVFEPTASTFNILERNCENLLGINLNMSAIWSETGEILFTELNDKFSAFNTAVNLRLTEMHLKDTKPTQRQVPALSLDDYVATTGVVCNFVKIDAEGAEPEILKGMQGLLTGPRPIVTLEVGDMESQSRGASRALVDNMLGFGYDVFEFSHGRIRRHELRETYEYDNLFFLPSPA